MFVVNSNKKSYLKNLFNSKWVFIGSYRGLEQTKKIFDESNRKFIAKEIENITDSVRKNFIDYIGKISTQQNNKAIWYSSRMASKSLSQTSMFHQYIYIKLIEKLSKEKSAEILIITDNVELLYNLKKIGLDNIEVIDTYLSFYKKQLFETMKGNLRILRYFLSWFTFRFFKNKRVSEFNLFIHTWIDNRTFTDLPKFTDSFFGDLVNFLTEKGYMVGRLAPLRINLKHILTLNKYFTNIVYPLSYLSFLNFIKIAFSKFNCKISYDDLADINDLKILNILSRNEIIKENISKVFVFYSMFFYSYKSLCPKIKINASFIYPFENQPWEKMFNLAFEKFNRIAYQHSAIGYNWLDFQLSQYERNETYLPKVILTSGQRWSTFLRKYFDNSIIKEAGAIRLTYLFSKQKKLLSNQSKNIVVALSTSISQTIAISLQRQLLNSLKRYNLSGYTIRIKPHPYLSKSACFEKAFLKYENCKFVSSDIGELLQDCTLLITFDSTVAFESIFLGIKTLYFVPEELSLGLEYFIRDNLFIAHEEDFGKILLEAIDSHSYPQVDLNEYFTSPNLNAFLEYINK